MHEWWQRMCSVLLGVTLGGPAPPSRRRPPGSLGTYNPSSAVGNSTSGFYGA